MRLTPERVAAERDRLHERAPTVVATINETRARLGTAFDTTVDPVDATAYRAEVDAVFADGDRAVNVAALAGLLRELDVTDDYPGFVVDEQLGRLLASSIAGGQPLATLAEATFHVVDALATDAPDTDPPDTDALGEDGDDPAGVDDLDAALAAGFQTRLPGWDWTAAESPFGVE
ncbi:hypothetical protein [Halobaculum sp. MBLA0143]|uniref:hypothetical protein n=1 Tax=Halobaculum sp. MBLA0143 TaxID=3079933 RepID=UPI003525CD15